LFRRCEGSLIQYSDPPGTARRIDTSRAVKAKQRCPMSLGLLSLRLSEGRRVGGCPHDGSHGTGSQLPVMALAVLPGGTDEIPCRSHRNVVPLGPSF
jgi:hypothetical protein